MAIFLIILLLVFVATMFSSSDSDEASPRQGGSDDRSRPGAPFQPRPDYPAWGSPPDWQDWQYDYYRRPRNYRVSSVMKAVLTTTLVCLLLMAGIFILNAKPSKSLVNDQPKEQPAERSQPVNEDWRKTEIRQPVKSPVRQTKPHCAQSRFYDLGTAREIQQTCPELEIFYTSDGRYCLVFFSTNTEDLDDFIGLLRTLKNLKPYDLNFKYRKVTDLCPGGIVQENGIHIWFCQA